MMKSPRMVAGLVLLLLATLLPVSALAAPQAQAARTYSGQVVQSYTNCGITQVFGVVLDSAGNPKPGVTVRLWWGGGEVRTTAGTYVRPETNGAGWDFTLNNRPIENVWYVAVDDGTNLLSEPVAVKTSGSCDAGQPNAVKVEFRNVPGGVTPAPAPAPAAPVPAAPQPVSNAPVTSNAEPAPAIIAGATCQSFSQTGGFSVCDDANGRFLTAYRRYGLQNIGYPISSRYKQDGFITQAFQKAILQWRPEINGVTFVNVFDELNRYGLDNQLYQARQTPYQLPAGWDGGVNFEQTVQKRQALLGVRPAMRSTYFAASDPLTFFGLPTSEVTDMGNHYAIRLQRAVLQEWKETVPWARAGQVTIANGGDIAKELGYLPSFALSATGVASAPAAPAPAAPVPAAPVPTAAPAPAASNEPARNLDGRLGALGVTIEPANVAPGQPYWRAVEVIWHDEDQAQGRHSIFVDVVNEGGSRVVGQPITIFWADGSQQLLAEPKPLPEYAVSFPMYAHSQSYSVKVEGLPSDVVRGMGLGDLEQRNWNIHVEYLIKFQRVIKR